ncbi:hypothetical protein BBP40_005576 [Aspergillus hancockii]|nr:hypothetical protein BBP40_005576 [Aspergillus hancockii]
MASTEQDSEEYLHESRQATIYAVTVVFMALETIAVALRFIAKIVGRLNWGFDDGLITLGYALFDVKYGGVGLHEARVLEIDPGMIVTWGKYIIIIPLIYFATVVPTKLTILHLYLSIFTQKPFRIICYIVGGIIIANWIATTIAGFLSCQPLSFFWTQQGHCFNINAFFRWGGFANILTDVCMLVLPIPFVWQLHASTRLKLGISFTFMLGSLGLISSIVRFYMFYVTDAETDGTWSASDLVIWTVVEGGIYLIAACLPTYRRLVKFIWNKMRFTSSAMTQESSRRRSGSALRPQFALRKGAPKFQHIHDSTWDGDDAIGLVEMGKRRPNIPAGQIVVESKFSVDWRA